MSTKVTMTISESSTSSPAKLGCNIGILKTKDGILKIFELIIPIICLIMIFRGELAGAAYVAPMSAFSLVLCFMACGLPTSLLLISYLMSPMAESLLSRIAYEVVNNIVSSLYCVVASMTFLILIANSELENTEKPIAVAVMGLVDGLLYFLSAYFSLKAFKSS